MKQLYDILSEGLLTSNESPLFPEFTSRIPALLTKLKNARNIEEYQEVSNQIADETTKRCVKTIKTSVVPWPDSVYIKWATSYSSKVDDFVKRIYVIFNGCAYVFIDGRLENPITKFKGVTSGYHLKYYTGGPPYFKMDPVVSKEIIQTIELIYDEKS